MSKWLAHYGVKGMKWGKRKAKIQPVASAVIKRSKDVVDANKYVAGTKDVLGELRSGVDVKYLMPSLREARRLEGELALDKYRKRLAKSDSKLLKRGSAAITKYLATQNRRKKFNMALAEKFNANDPNSPVEWTVGRNGESRIRLKRKR